MLEKGKAQVIALLMAVGWLGWACSTAAAAVRIEGQVQVGGAPVANSTVTLWAGSANAPRRLAQAQTGADGRFMIRVEQSPGGDASLYLLATGGQSPANKAGGNNPAIALLAVLGSKPPARVVINEMTTVASVWTNAQFLNGAALKGYALGLRIAAGNVPNFVDLAPKGRPDQGQIDLRGLGKGAMPLIQGAVSSRHRPTGSDLGDQCRWRLRRPLPGRRSEQGGDLQDRL
jgi:hypothetical protein